MLNAAMIFSLVIGLFFLPNFHCSSKLRVFSIDFGAEQIKLAGFSPGEKIKIIENAHSQRYTSAGLCLSQGHRQMGAFYSNCASRNPLQAFPYLPRLLGLSFEDPFVQWYRANVNDALVPTQRQTVALRLEGREVPVEEALAMIVDFLRDSAVGPEGTIDSCVLALPACYGPFERETIVQACAIAGLPVNEVVVDLDAAALEYAVYVASLTTAASQNSSSTEAQGKKILFIDAGASHVAASAVQISPKGKIEILDRTCSKIGSGGGLFINQEITRKIVVPSLLQQSGLVALPAAVKQRLASLVEKAKKELTGLEKTFLSIEINDKIYTVPIERKAVEEACSQVFDQMIAPIEELISISQGGGLESFDLVIPLGKASKLFLFEDWASQRFGTKLAPVMNQEEAIAKGASLAASVLFNAFKLGKKVTLEPLFVGKEAVKAKIGGDKDFEIQWNKPFEIDDSIVSIPVSLGERLLFNVHLSEVPPKAPEQSDASKNTSETETSQVPPPSAASLSQISLDLTPGWKIKCSSSTKSQANSKRNCTIELVPGPLSLNETQIKQSKDALEKIKRSEWESFQLQKSKSELEALIYNVSGLLDPLSQFVSPNDQKPLKKQMQKAEKSLNDPKSTFASIQAAQSDLQKLLDPITFRKTQWNERPETIEEANRAIEAAKKNHSEWSALFQKENGDVGEVGVAVVVGSLKEEDTAELHARIKEFEHWLKDSLERQAAKAAYEEPFFVVDDVHKKIRLLKEALERCKRLLFTPTAKPEKKQEPEKEEAAEQSTKQQGEQAGEESTKQQGEATEQSKETEANEFIKVDEPVSQQTNDDSPLSHQHPSSEDRSDL